MHDAMGRLYYLPHVASDVYSYVEKCADCWRHLRHRTHRKIPQWLPPEGSLEFIAANSHGRLPNTKTGSRFVFVFTNCFAKLTSAIPPRQTTSAHVSKMFLEDCVMPYDIPDRFLTENELQHAWKLFNTAWIAAGSQIMTTIAHHPQAKQQIERCTEKMFDRLRHYIGEHRDG